MRQFIPCWVFFSLSFLTMPAFAGGTNFLVGGSMASAVVTGPSAYGGGARSIDYGGGLVFEFELIPSKLDLEVGGYYMPRGFIQTGTSPVQVNFTTLQLPLSLRVYVVPGLSFGLGAYFSHGLGVITSYPTDTPSSVTTQNYNTLSYNSDDIGVLANIGFSFPIIKPFKVVLRGQFLYGFSNISEVPGIGTTLYDMQAFAGLRIGS